MAQPARKGAGARALAIAAAAAAGVLVVVLARLATRGRPPAFEAEPLRGAMRVEKVLANLLALFEARAVVDEDARAPVRIASLRPGSEWRVAGRGRRAIVAPPPAAVRYRTTLPAGASLRFGIAVEGRGRRVPGARGVRFTVDVDGERQFARELNPATTRHDRRWFDQTVKLDAWSGREVEIVLRTEAAAGAGPLAGTPGWSHVRIVRGGLRERRTATPAAPNVLVLLVDTLRADRLGCYGATPSSSPILDGIAAGGMVFEETIAQSAWTLPSVASIFTGLHPRSHGVLGILDAGHRDGWGPQGTPVEDQSYLAEGIPTLAERAQEAGITTVAVSANPLVSAGTNLARGFETFVEFGLEGRPPAWRAAREINRAFLDWLAVNGQHRFFAYLHYMDVHDPYDPPAAFRPVPPPGIRPKIAAGDIHEVAQRIARGEGGGLGAAELAYLRSLYDAQIRQWDAELGALREGLAAHSVLDRTVLIVTADHGEEFLEHGRLKHGAHLYEEAVRIPLVLSGPGIARARIAPLAQGVDLFPTIAALLGAATPAGLPGRDLLAGGGGDVAVSETRFGSGSGGPVIELVALRTPAWKLIHSVTAGRFELYDLLRDPAERHDLFGTALQGADLARRLRVWADSVPAPPRAAGADSAFRDKLRALGYVGDAPR